jgi:hypothetical protein
VRDGSTGNRPLDAERDRGSGGLARHAHWQEVADSLCLLEHIEESRLPSIRSHTVCRHAEARTTRIKIHVNTTLRF